MKTIIITIIQHFNVQTLIVCRNIINIIKFKDLLIKYHICNIMTSKEFYMNNDHPVELKI